MTGPSDFLFPHIANPKLFCSVLSTSSIKLRWSNRFSFANVQLFPHFRLFGSSVNFSFAFSLLHTFVWTLSHVEVCADSESVQNKTENQPNGSHGPSWALFHWPVHEEGRRGGRAKVSESDGGYMWVCPCASSQDWATSESSRLNLGLCWTGLFACSVKQRHYSPGERTWTVRSAMVVLSFNMQILLPLLTIHWAAIQRWRSGDSCWGTLSVLWLLTDRCLSEVFQKLVMGILDFLQQRQHDYPADRKCEISWIPWRHQWQVAIFTLSLIIEWLDKRGHENKAAMKWPLCASPLRK